MLGLTGAERSLVDVSDGTGRALTKAIQMKPSRSFLSFLMLAILTLGSAGCSTPAPQQVAELRDYPGQSYFCYLHKQDPGC